MRAARSRPGQHYHQVHLAAIVQQVLRDGLRHLLPDAAVYLAEVDKARSFRHAATRVLLQVHDDPSSGSARMTTWGRSQWAASLARHK